MESQGDIKFIGIIRVPLANLVFNPGTGEKPYNQKQTDQLERLFRRTSVNHAERRHWIDGYIEQNAEEGLLCDLKLSRSQLGGINSREEGYGGDHVNFCEWHERLSITKQKAFFYIKKRLAVMEALDRLILLNGVIESLHLSYFLKIFDKRLDDELCAGLDKIHKQWSRITDGRRLDLLDKDTVAALEGRAPSVSTEDQAWIASLFQQRRHSSSVSDASPLQNMEHFVFKETGLIHSLRVAHVRQQVAV
ncbi:hypothetical protein V2A60_008035 [Cordyceps javanica]